MSNIKKNFFYNIAYQVLTMILPLITAPYISRILGTEGVGVYSYTYSVVYYFMLIAMLGINNYGNRTIAKIRDNKQELNKNFWSIYSLQLINTCIMIFSYIIYLNFFNIENRNIATIQIIYLISVALDVNWFFFGLEKFKLTVTRNTIIKLLTVLSVFMFVKTKNDIWIYTVIMSLGTLISQIVMWIFLKEYVSFIKVKPKEIGKHIKPAFILFIPVIAVSLYKIMDKIMLGNITDMNQVGLYENSEKIITIITSLVTALGTVMLPRMSNLFANGEMEKGKKYITKSLEFTIIFSSALTFGIMSIADTFAPLFFGKEFTASGRIIELLSITTIFISIANVIRTQFLIPREKDKSYIISVLLGAVVNLIFNILLIPKYQANGAAIGTIIAEFTVMIYQIFAVNKDINVIKTIFDNVHFFVLGIIMLIVNIIISKFVTNSLVLLCLQVGFGVIFYITTSIIVLMIKYKQSNIRALYLKIKNI